VNLLLDTHAVLWFLNNDPLLSSSSDTLTETGHQNAFDPLRFK
jgi:PIN domain nuclease of toxin-antitoxin system